MKFEDVRHLVLHGMGEYRDEYYTEFHKLEEDMDFFNLYLHRNKKCDTFHYTIIPCENFVAFSAFIDIYKQYGYGYLEESPDRCRSPQYLLRRSERIQFR